MDDRNNPPRLLAAAVIALIGVVLALRVDDQAAAMALAALVVALSGLLR